MSPLAYATLITVIYHTTFYLFLTARTVWYFQLGHGLICLTDPSEISLEMSVVSAKFFLKYLCILIMLMYQ